MDLQDVLNHARDTMTVKRVFGDPFEKDGTTVIPVANVMGGAGGGGGQGPMLPPDGAPADGAGGGSGSGAGYGLRVTPAGVYVIRAGEVEWKPAVDANRIAVQRTIGMVVGLLVLRSIIRTIARR
jgi:uncharacterized spore protein YtfJ